MANAVYDPESEQKESTAQDLGPGHNSASGDPSDPRGEGPDKLDSVRDAESNPSEKGLYNPSTSSEDDSTPSDSGTGGGLYNPKSGRNKAISSVIKDNKKTLALSISGIAALVTIIAGLFVGLGSLNLANFMANVEAKGFARYQVDTRNRSSKWLQAYMTVRFAEVDNPNVKPKDRDNIIFRADRVDNNKPFTDWYRTMRASKFEDDLFEKYGIKFVSVARQEGNVQRVRPGMISIQDKQIKINPKDIGYDDLDALSDGDANKMNRRLTQVIETRVFEGGDKVARKEISQVLKQEYPGWWRAVKRYHLRHDIQNMIGVRKWTFFENKREAIGEKTRSTRNAVVKKVVDQALPEDSKSGKFIECLFGLSTCTASSDVSNPSNRQYSPNPNEPRQADRKQPDGDPDTPDPTYGDGSGTSSLQAGSDGASKAGETLRGALPKLLKTANWASIIDSLARFHEAVQGNKLSKLVTQAKMQYVVGLYTTFKIADDQFKTGEMDGQELKDFMGQYGRLSNGEGTKEVLKGAGSGTVSAASDTYTEAPNKKEFCSEKHQTEMEKPENKEAADKEFQHRCPKDKVGNDKNNARILEDAWNSGPGVILGPFLEAYNSVFGGVFDFINSALGKISGAILSATGLSGAVEDIAAYGAAKALEFGGANMNITEQTPSGRVGNLLVQGGSALGESTTRQQGGALTTTESRVYTTKKYLAYLKEDQQNSSLYERYASLSNPRSLAAMQIPSLDNAFNNDMFTNISSLFSAVLRTPATLFSNPAFAATQNQPDGYEAARWTGIDTYDFPKECIETDPTQMTPENSTNADDLGYFTQSELSWEMMSNKESWYDALYTKVDGDEDKAMKVYNCALLDNTVRGGIGAPYGYKGELAFEPSATTSETTETEAGDVPGDPKELATKILESKKLTDQDGRYIAQIKNISKGDYSCNVNPDILAMLYGVTVNDGHRIVMSSLNRSCTGSIAGAGTKSYHYANGGGHAIDVVGFDGSPVEGKNAATVKYLNAASKYLPTKTGYGQEQCDSGFKIPKGSYTFEDSCDHQHIQVPVKQIKE